MRSRICAWIVTSSAVLGSSAMRPHAARHLVRVLVDPLPRGRDAHLFQHLDDPVPPPGGRELEVEPHRLQDLVTDREDRVERRHRLLEDHADPAAADLAHARLGHRHQVLAVEEDPAAHDLARRDREEPHHGERGDRFPAAALPHHPHGLAGPRVERHAVHRRDGAFVGVEVRLEVDDVEQRLPVAVRGGFRHLGGA
jgi:hypothetical protein